MCGVRVQKGTQTKQPQCCKKALNCCYNLCVAYTHTQKQYFVIQSAKKSIIIIIIHLIPVFLASCMPFRPCAAIEFILSIKYNAVQQSGLCGIIMNTKTN